MVAIFFISLFYMPENIKFIEYSNIQMNYVFCKHKSIIGWFLCQAVSWLYGKYTGIGMLLANKSSFVLRQAYGQHFLLNRMYKRNSFQRHWKVPDLRHCSFYLPNNFQLYTIDVTLFFNVFVSSYSVPNCNTS